MTEVRSGSDSETGERRRHSRRGTLSEVAEQRLRQSGRQSAVSIGSGVEGSAVLADYTSLDKLQKKVSHPLTLGALLLSGEGCRLLEEVSHLLMPEALLLSGEGCRLLEEVSHLLTSEVLLLSGEGRRLQKKLGEVEEKLDVLDMAEMLPKLREFQQALSGSQEDVQGLWQSLQLMKKVDANEEGIDKLTGIIEHTMSKLKKVKKHTDRLDKQLSELLGMAGEKGEKPVSLADMETKYVEIKNVIAGLMGVAQEGGMPAASSDDLRSLGAGIVTWSGLEGALEDVKGDLKAMDQLSDETLKAVEQQQTEARQQELIEQGGHASNSETKAKRLLAHLSELLDKHKILEKRVSQMEAALGDNFSDKVIEQLTLLKASASQIQELRMKLSMTEKEQSGGWSDLDVVAEGESSSQGSFVGPSLSLNLTSLREPSQMDLNHLTDWLNYNKARMEQLEKALVSQSEQVRDFGDRLGDQVVSFRDKLERVERELAGMLGRLSSAANKPGMTREDAAALHDAYAKIQALQMDVESLSAVSKKIVDDRGQIDDELAMLIRALEELKECKVDRATLDELIETKADRSSVEKKVSSWQFEQACQELSEGLGSMLEKMGSQETDWIRSVDEIHADLHKKLDRVELAPLRRYINSRLKNIMAKLNRLIAEDESPDACATRRKIIRNLNCLSCDDPKKITGLTAAPVVPLLEPFPPSVGDRHQISYRMGNIRRQQQMRCEPYKDMTSHQGAFRSHIKQEIDYMTHRGIPHHPTCPLYNNRIPHGRCTCVATRFCGGSHTKINCVDTRMRRIGLGAPLMPSSMSGSCPALSWLLRMISS
ncbi:uncharacterized protein LOC119091030 [Pollicipes pollicipes]|uniref:uncharacterized protein LOC119091030 n=1 Tax=Pollicipes pollicipes TaxID=41117 RepID=UPI001885A301|nr:uncharacterized protein LOC119091030 [Pollicipes pollicipes]